MGAIETTSPVLLRKEQRSMICVWLDEEDFSEMRDRLSGPRAGNTARVETLSAAPQIVSY